MKRNFVVKSSTLYLVPLLFMSCSNRPGEGGYPGGPTEVNFAAVKTGDAEVKNEYTCAIEGRSNIEIRPQVTGYLSKIYMDEGAYVKAGQPLFKVEDRLYREQLNNAKASLQSASASLITAKIELERKTELVRNKIVSELQVQEANAAYLGAKAAVAQAESAIQSAQINIDFALIKAPVSGYVGRFNYRLGSLLSPTNQQALTVISDNQQVYAYFSLSENDFVAFQNQHPGNSIAEKLKGTSPVTLLLSDGRPYDLKGKIDAVEGQFNKSTGSITLRAKFDNPKDILRSGNTGKVLLERNIMQVPLLPIASTVTYQDKIFVYTADKDGKVVQLPIAVSGKSGDNFILSSGLKAGDRYIAQGFERLQAGMPVVEKSPIEHK
ncbi:efflux RND transporter periplasmic adaptor subunit [Sphingobacterium sp. UME9]|uniref:efflux RND transporter periplasmic adaptor subunit n=1 Tax=Sphingobacterium sp. UME9 TaxID=1862316 RepID=UPI001602FA7C|nr:efflux RND transporter periplasmic adaptor subunit [Sphingobacterium sp. UME9]MBB1642876.1 efflux transporter periplasmic adaptor subunit [Sphingobacterium sp. UME9]